MDIGSVRHWIEDTKPSTESYFIAFHICSDSNVIGTGTLKATLYGSNGQEVGPLALVNQESLPQLFVPGKDFIFVMDNIPNIGWMVNRINIAAESGVDVCIDMVIAGRLDGAELVQGSGERITLSIECGTDPNTSCHTEFELDLQSNCGSSDHHQDISNIHSAQMEVNHYIVIIHVCPSTTSVVGGGNNVLWARLHGVIGTSEWIQLESKAIDDSWQMDGTYLFSVDVVDDLGINIESIEFQVEGPDGLCVDMITAGNSRYPTVWKGNRDIFFLDNPCAVNPIHGIQCYTMKEVVLICYDL